MKGSEFKRKVERLAGTKGLKVRWESRQGKGSHGRLFVGERFTTLKDLKKEIPMGLLNAMCKQLGFGKEELNEPGKE